MSRRAAPQVVTGSRSPLDRTAAQPANVAESELQRQLAAVATFAGGAPAKEGEVVYQSRYFAYRYQITAPADLFNPATGVVTRARPVTAQFAEGVYRTSDPAIIERLDSSPECGVGKDFWRAEEMKKAALEKQVQSLTATVAAAGDPKLIERVVADLMPLLGKTEFELPAAPKPSAE